MPWVEIFAVFVVSHLVGDFLLQTDWQAKHKHGGLGRDPVARRALISHVTTYTLAFVPAFIWLGPHLDADLIAVVALVALPHLVQDDGRLLAVYVRRVKHTADRPSELLSVAVDQSFHMVVLLLVALLAGAWT
jgi:hypothetical protein